MDNQEFHRWYKRLIEDPPQAPPEIVWEHISLELDREFYDWYRSQTEESGQEPPEAVWDNIEDALDSQLHGWYQTSIEEPGEEPPEQVWNNIQDGLDIDDTWVRIAHELDRKWKKRTRQLVYALAAAVMLLFALQIFLPTREPLPLGKSETNTQQPPAQPEQDAAVSQRPRQEQLALSRERQSDNNVPANKESEKPGKKDPSTEEAVGEELPNAPSNLLAKASTLEMALDVDLNTQAAPITDQGTSVTQAQPEKKSTPVRYYAGISGEIGNSWLLSNKTIYSIRKSPYSSASPETGKSYGIMGGAALNEHLDLQAEALFTNESGQRYKEYTDGQVLNNQIQLNYSSLKIAGRYEIIGSSFQLPVSHHLVLGVYGSYLKNARQLTDGKTENIKGAYKNYNLGMVAGYELDTHIAPNYTLSAGLRFNPGFINIYEGTSMLPAQFNKTYSSSVNINIALKYSLSAK